VDLPPRDIEPAPGFGTTVRAEFIAGMGKLNGEFVIILDVARVLSADDLAALMPALRESQAA
jgi:purine-binding chemotaxis protein CheW